MTDSHLNDTTASVLLDSLQNFTVPCLEIVNLDDNKLGPQAIGRLASLLNTSECKVFQLSLRNVGLTDSTTPVLAEAISKNRC